MIVRYGPLAKWPQEPTPSAKRQSRWSFRNDYSDTLDILRGELSKLGSDEVLIEGFWLPGDIRQDGQPRKNARPPVSPGVVVSFDSIHGGMRYLTDVYELWEHNVRAVALGLGALRAVNRYGISHRAEQYRGFAALGAANGTPMAFTSATSAEAKLVNLVQQMAGDDSDVHTLDARSLYRRALKVAHPDQGGSRELLDAVRDAGQALGLA